MSYPAYPEYKDSGVEWLGEVPAHWNVDRLKWSAASCRNGLWGDEAQGDQNDFPCVRVADFDRDKMKVVLDRPTVRNVGPSERAGRVLSKGDLILEKSGGGDKQPVGFVVLYSDDRAAICSNFTAKIELEQGMDASYWKYCHAAAYSVRLNVPSIKQTSGIQNLDQKSYLDERVVFPPQAEQEQIACFLDHETARIDALIEEQQRLIELLKEKRQAVISHAVTKGLDPNVPMKDSGVEWLGEVPEHWNIVSLRHLVECCDGNRIPLNAEQRHKKKGDVPYWGASQIVDYVDEALFDEDLILLGEDGAPFFDRSKSVAFFSRGPIWPNNHIHVLRPLLNRGCRWIVFALNITDYSGFIEGATRSKLTQSRMMTIPVPMPPEQERCQIISYIDEEIGHINVLIEQASKVINLLQERRSCRSLIPF